MADAYHSHLPFILFDRNFLSNKTLRWGCAVRGEENCCFATPLTREEFASELFINLAFRLRV